MSTLYFFSFEHWYRLNLNETLKIFNMKMVVNLVMVDFGISVIKWGYLSDSHALVLPLRTVRQNVRYSPSIIWFAPYLLMPLYHHRFGIMPSIWPHTFSIFSYQNYSHISHFIRSYTKAIHHSLTFEFLGVCAFLYFHLLLSISLKLDQLHVFSWDSHLIIVGISVSICPQRKLSSIVMWILTNIK